MPDFKCIKADNEEDVSRSVAIVNEQRRKRMEVKGEDNGGEGVKEQKWRNVECVVPLKGQQE